MVPPLGIEESIGTGVCDNIVIHNRYRSMPLLTTTKFYSLVRLFVPRVYRREAQTTKSGDDMFDRFAWGYGFVSVAYLLWGIVSFVYHCHEC